jgi:superfamily I DNA and/or RNA helicase
MGNAIDRVIKLLDDGISSGSVTQKEAINIIAALKDEMLDWKPDSIWQDLLGSAHIVFCTLASSGAGVLKRSIGEVDDLIVDEAAASCEPEMYIPFYFKPQRLLAVGDPKQLPATVLSRLAAVRGLDKSLHERLMYDSKYPHIMLDVQYRMNPEISSFPCRHFYGSKVFNGPNVLRYVIMQTNKIQRVVRCPSQPLLCY